ncbi:flagellar biosynthesis protein FlhF [Marinobacterium rhizophilum]|uniref:Flagellar biosynthesis protein FlhF n=1 Tax=Marinobacterium rhizophilum TaxID=420402 RepID=A0ABY5HFB4_9GAMM|nr:flagellar biosynthesis protein FlhF [Marinobacterium rhizophilum]UTW10022.1 flagellar biosynthesis protein FlhF [Marinobacterium rhizophilum]
MKVKRIFAPDMRQAMRRVREEIGPDAVIVSNHRVAGGVEVVAAHEQEYEAAQAEFKRQSQERRRREEQVQTLTHPGRQRTDSQGAGREEPGRQEPGRQGGALEDEMRKVKARIASAQQQSGVPSEPDMGVMRNRQIGQDSDEDLRSILESLKQRQKSRAAVVAPPFESAAFEEAPFAQAGRSEAPLRAERDPVDRPAPEPQRRPQPAPARQPPVQPAEPARSVEESQDHQRILSMQDEIQQLKVMLQQQLQAQQQPNMAPRAPLEPQAPPQPTVAPVPPAAQPAPAQARLSRRLDSLGIGPRVVRHLVSSIEQDIELDKAWRSSLARLSDAIPVVGEEFIERGGMVAFVGPTGVGKTTTIGKLAARYVLKHGSSSLALVTTDTYRIAAHEQLRTFGRILDVPVRVVDENHSLDEVLHSLKGKRLVLIDTAGMSADEPHTAAQIELLQGVSLRLKKLLVLSCSSQKRVIESAYSTYQGLGLSGCVLSKLDESGSLGEALTLSIEKQLPIAYVTDGQKIPDDIGVARRHDLVSRAVVTAQKAQEREQQSGEGPDLTFIGRAG